MDDALSLLKNSGFYEIAVSSQGEEQAQKIVQEIVNRWDSASPETRRALFREGQELMLGNQPVGEASSAISELIQAATGPAEFGGVGLFLIGAGLVCMGVSLM